jgi:cytochrome c oxidase subunit IV
MNSDEEKTMSDPHHVPATTYDVAKDVDNPSTLFIIFAIVIGLALVTIGLSSLGLGKYGLPIQLAIGCVQAGLVAYFFMHLRQGDRVVILTALSSIFWMGILFVLFLSDYMTRLKVVN